MKGDNKDAIGIFSTKDKSMVMQKAGTKRTIP